MEIEGEGKVKVMEKAKFTLKKRRERGTKHRGREGEAGRAMSKEGDGGKNGRE